MTELPEREEAAQRAVAKMPQLQRCLVADLERSLERRLVIDDYKCIDWQDNPNGPGPMLTISRQPLLAEWHQKMNQRENKFKELVRDQH